MIQFPKWSPNGPEIQVGSMEPNGTQRNPKLLTGEGRLTILCKVNPD